MSNMSNETPKKKKPVEKGEEYWSFVDSLLDNFDDTKTASRPSPAEVRAERAARAERKEREERAESTTRKERTSRRKRAPKVSAEEAAAAVATATAPFDEPPIETTPAFDSDLLSEFGIGADSSTREERRAERVERKEAPVAAPITTAASEATAEEAKASGEAPAAGGYFLPRAKGEQAKKARRGLSLSVHDVEETILPTVSEDAPAEETPVVEPTAEPEAPVVIPTEEPVVLPEIPSFEAVPVEAAVEEEAVEEEAEAPVEEPVVEVEEAPAEVEAPAELEVEPFEPTPAEPEEPATENMFFKPRKADDKVAETKTEEDEFFAAAEESAPAAEVEAPAVEEEVEAPVEEKAAKAAEKQAAKEAKAAEKQAAKEAKRAAKEAKAAEKKAAKEAKAAEKQAAKEAKEDLGDTPVVHEEKVTIGVAPAVADFDHNARNAEFDATFEEPKKKGGALRVIRNIIIILVSLAIVACIAVLGYNYGQKRSNARLFDEVAALYTTGQKADNLNGVQQKYLDVAFPDDINPTFGELYAMNQDLVGWVSIDDTDFSYPVVQTDNDTFYQNHNFKKVTSPYGTPFLSSKNDSSELDLNNVIYGKNAEKSPTLFGALEEYRSADYFKANPIINYETLTESYQFKVYAVFITNSAPEQDNGYVFDYTVPNLGTVESFAEYVDQLNQRRLYDTGVDILSTDKLLTLSTSVDDFEGANLVVVGRLVREDESLEIDEDEVETNKSPRYPQVWYDNNGKENPYTSDDNWIPTIS